MLKYLRIAVTALSLTACVLLIALWVRSYRWTDSIRRERHGLRVLSSDYGTLMFLRNPDHRFGRPGRWKVGSYEIDVDKRRSNPPTRFAWWFNRHNGNLTVRTPHWFLAAACMAFAIMPWIRSRFSLRTLLIATTMAAVGLGVIVLLN